MSQTNSIRPPAPQKKGSYNLKLSRARARAEPSPEPEPKLTPSLRTSRAEPSRAEPSRAEPSLMTSSWISKFPHNWKQVSTCSNISYFFLFLIKKNEHNLL